MAQLSEVGHFRASDFSTLLIARNRQKDFPRPVEWIERSIYQLEPESDHADLIVCCEVLEHLKNPEAGLEKLYRLRAKYYLFSVPNEPTWRISNMLRGKYLAQWGNTPGHLNHWSPSGFVRCLHSAGFEPTLIKHPFPWTVVLCQSR
jgi:2-polyprenyl-3-methyl-5-hydroxy-6-metoxy-1,4-benzoquinol methylase